MPRNFALTIEYDGANFHGWQVQNGYRTVESELQKALQAVVHQPVKLFVASRTDAGVHARAQVAHFLTEAEFPAPRLHAALSQILPEDMAVLAIQERPEAFHARHDAQGKWYRYTVFNRPIAPAIQRAYVLPVREKLRLGPMERAAKLLLGTHDFISFGVNMARDPVESTVKTLHRLDIRREAGNEGHTIYFDIVGNSFLYRMVRSLVGTLLEIGMGKRAPESVLAILDKKDRCAAGVTVAPQGLCLMQVFYDDPSKFIPV